MPAKKVNIALGQRVLRGGLCRPSRRELGGLIFFVTFLHQGKKVKKIAARRRGECGLRRGELQAASRKLQVIGCVVCSVSHFKAVYNLSEFQQFHFTK
jgi:hypothetical protein